MAVGVPAGVSILIIIAVLLYCHFCRNPPHQERREERNQVAETHEFTESVNNTQMIPIAVTTVQPISNINYSHLNNSGVNRPSPKKEEGREQIGWINEAVAENPLQVPTFAESTSNGNGPMIPISDTNPFAPDLFGGSALNNIPTYK